MSLIKMADEPILVTTIKMLVFGQPGIGKTTFALTAPDPLIIDCDSGMRRVSPQFRKARIDVSSYADAEGVFREDLTSYKTLVVDTVGKLLDYMIAAIITETPKLGYQGNLTLQGYGVLKSKFKAFNDRCSQLGLNVIYVSHDKETSEGDQKVLRPDVAGASLGVLVREMDLVGYMESRNNRRTISFTPTDRFYAKNTCELPDSIEIEDMRIVPVHDMKWNIEKILARFRDTQAAQNDQLEEYNQLLSIIDAKIDMIKDPSSAQVVSDEIVQLKHMWDSKVQSQVKFREKIKAIGVAYTKEAGFHLAPPSPASEAKPAEATKAADENKQVASAGVQQTIPEPSQDDDSGVPGRNTYDELPTAPSKSRSKTTGKDEKAAV